MIEVGNIGLREGRVSRMKQGIQKNMLQVCWYASKYLCNLCIYVYDNLKSNNFVVERAKVARLKINHLKQPLANFVFVLQKSG